MGKWCNYWSNRINQRRDEINICKQHGYGCVELKDPRPRDIARKGSERSKPGGLCHPTLVDIHGPEPKAAGWQHMIDLGRIIAENGMLKAGEKVSVSIVGDGDKDYLKFECLR